MDCHHSHQLRNAASTQRTRNALNPRLEPCHPGVDRRLIQTASFAETDDAQAEEPRVGRPIEQRTARVKLENHKQMFNDSLVSVLFQLIFT